MNRIEQLASLTKGSTIICDIGCDHAYVLIEAIRYYGVSRGLACDVAQGPLEMAKKHVLSSKLEDKIECVLSDGFENVNQDFDTAIIAGMGGSLIVDILYNGLDKIKGKKLILQPNNDRPKVREFLSTSGFIIVDEIAIIDQNKYYEIIVALPGDIKYDLYDIKYGPILRKTKPDVFIQQMKKNLNQYQDIVKRIKNLEERIQIEQEIKELLEIFGG